MGWLRSVLTGEPSPVVSHALNLELAQSQGLTFAVDAESMPAEIFGIPSYASPVAAVPRIDRKGAIQVPAVKRARDLIAGTLGTLPIDLIGPDKQTIPSPLFEQPEKTVPRSVTMTRLFEDLLFEQVAWWLITEFAYDGYPYKVKRLNPRTVTVNEDTGQVYVNGKPVPDERLIRFDSPNDGLLTAGARAIRTCLALDAAAQRYADEPMPLGFFTPTDDTDPVDDDDVIGLLNGWRDARQSRATGYVPAALKYNPVQFSPEQMQLADARQHAVLEIARVTGIDPEELGVSTTSRTYANQQDRRKNFLDFSLGGYRQAVEDRLSMGDVTHRGRVVKLNLSSFLRSDDKTRMETHKLALDVGAVTKEEIRELEDRPPLSPSQVQQPAPLRALPRAEETA